MNDRRLDRLYRRFQRDGDVEALGRVFDLAAPELLRVARHLCGDEAEAEDALQSSFVVAIEKRAQYDPARRFMPWMLGILAHRAMEARRRAEKVPDPGRIPERRARDPLAEAAQSEFEEAVRSTVERLPQTYAGAIREYLVGGRSPADIASMLGISVNAAHVRLHRGLKLLRRALPPALATGSILGVAPARGLASVKARVLSCASASLPAVPAALPVVAGAATSLLGGAIAMKKTVLLTLGIGLAATGSGLLWLDSGPRRDGVSAEATRTAADAGFAEEPPAGSPAMGGEPVREVSERIELLPASDGGTDAVVALVDGAGIALAGTRAALWVGAEILFSGPADERGDIAVPSRADAASLLVLPEGAAPHLAEIALEAGRRTVVVDGGRVLSGWILVDGRAPDEVLKLELGSDRAFGNAEGVPASVWAGLDLPPGGPERLVRSTDENGAFRFSGLPPDWSGSLRLPNAYVVADGAASIGDDRSARIDAPVEGLRLEVRRLPGLVGRVVEPGDGRPVPNPGVQASLVLSGATQGAIAGTVTIGGSSDESGRFRIPIPRFAETFHRGSVEIFGPDGRGRRSIAFERPRPGEWDLGDLQLAATRDVHFVVRDRSGRPVEGAVGLADDDPATKSDPTDADGRGVVRDAPASPSRLAVGRLGFAAIEVPVPAQGDEPLSVTLRPSNQLEVRLRTPDGGVPGDLRVALVSREPFFAGEPGWNPARAHVAAGASRVVSGSRGANGGTMIFEADPSGRTVFCSLRSSVSFTVRVIDRFGSGVVEEQVDSVGEFETRVVEAVIRARPKHVVGRVLDEEGRPLVNAQVTLQIGPNGSGSSTDANGDFRFESVYAERLTVTVSKPGFVAPALREVRTPDVGESLEFRMARSHRVVVRVEDEDGKPVQAEIGLRDSGSVGGCQVRPLEEGLYEILDLPAGDVVILASVAGHEYELAHSCKVPEAKIVVPVHAHVEVSLDPAFDLNEGEVFWVALLSKGGERPPQDRLLLGDRYTDAPVASFDVLAGSYEAVLQRDSGKGGKAHGSRDDLSRPVPFVAKPGERVQVALRP